MKAIVLERNPLVCRKLERFLRCAGYQSIAVDQPEKVGPLLDDAYLIGADSFDADVILHALERKPGLKAILWTAEPLDRALRYVVEHDGVSNILGRADFDTAPRGWELMLVLRRLLRPQDEGPKFAWYLNWGFSGFQERIDSSSTRDKVVHKVARFVDKLGVRKGLGDHLAEVTHELLMNAMYGAPVDETGNPKYAMDRKRDLLLPESERPVVKVASDGTTLAVQVTDPFGRLRRGDVFSGLARGLSGGEMDRSRGGAGLGMTVIHKGTVATFFDVVEGAKTEVTGIFELDTTQRDFRLMPKSLHFFRR